MKGMQKIDRAIEEKMMQYGKMGTEPVDVEIKLTPEEKEEFLNCEKYNSCNYSWGFEGDNLIISYVEETEAVKTAETLSYVLGQDGEIQIGQEYYFGQLWDGEGDGEELLESGAVSPDNENVVAFEILERDPDDICDTIVRVTDIY